MAQVDAAHAEGRHITTSQSVTAGVAALATGALLGGAAHWASTAKALKEEGIDPKARVKALPVAAKALAVSTVCCTILGTGLYYAAGWGGLEFAASTDLSSHQAVALAEEQRDAVRKAFRKQIHNWTEDK